jgi:type IV pilus assembly protein PilB
MQVTDEIEALTVKRASANEVRRTAITEGMRLLRDDGLSKAAEGLTSIEDVLRVTA